MIDDSKQRSTSSPSGKEALLQLMEEMVASKQAVQDVLKISPEDIQLHRIHGMYTGHILDIRKTMMQEAAVDRDQLLIDALKGVVNYLLQKGEGKSAWFIGENLEEIGNKVKEFWQDSKAYPNWHTAMTKYADSSRGKSHPSVKLHQSKKSGGKRARKRI